MLLGCYAHNMQCVANTSLMTLKSTHAYSTLLTSTLTFGVSMLKKGGFENALFH